MDTLLMQKRRNRTVYVRDDLMEAAERYGKRPDVERSSSRIIEYALADYLRSHGVDLGPDFIDPASGADE